jgi:hypothetical protein
MRLDHDIDGSARGLIGCCQQLVIASAVPDDWVRRGDRLLDWSPFAIHKRRECRFPQGCRHREHVTAERKVTLDEPFRERSHVRIAGVNFIDNQQMPRQERCAHPGVARTTE